MRKILLLLVVCLVTGLVWGVGAADNAGSDRNETGDSNVIEKDAGNTTENSEGTGKDAGNTTPATNYTVKIIASPQNGTAPLKVDFSLNITFSEEEIVNTTWNFDDGGAYSYNQTMSYTFEEPRTYNVTVEVRLSEEVFTDILQVKVTELENLAASFDVSTTSGTAPLTVTFTDTSSGSPTQWTWDFDDGKSSVQNPIHNFTEPGSYNVTLIVTNESGSTASTTKTITVKSPVAPTETQRAATPIPTTARPTEAAEVMSAVPVPKDPVPNPMDVVDEFLRLLFAMINPSSYVLIYGDMR
jgi:PKD repeat protein